MELLLGISVLLNIVLAVFTGGFYSAAYLLELQLNEEKEKNK